MNARTSPTLKALLALCALLWACAGSQRRGDQLDDDALGPLIELVPPGPDVLLSAKPRVLAQQEGPRSLYRALVSEERDRAFAERTGIDPLTVEELVAFELPPNGYVLLLRGPFDARSVVERAGERLALTDVVTDEPLARREGLAGQGRYAYAMLAAHSVLVARDAPPQLVAAILARRRDREAPGALASPDARALYREHAAQPLLLLAPKPLQLAPGTNVSLLFARERALAVTVQPLGQVLGVGIDMRGEFPPGAEHNFRALAKSLAGEALGRALGLSRVPETMAIRVDAEGAYVTFALDARELVAGVRMLFYDDMRSLFGV